MNKILCYLLLVVSLFIFVGCVDYRDPIEVDDKSPYEGKDQVSICHEIINNFTNNLEKNGKENKLRKARNTRYREHSDELSNLEYKGTFYSVYFDTIEEATKEFDLVNSMMAPTSEYFGYLESFAYNGYAYDIFGNYFFIDEVDSWFYNDNGYYPYVKYSVFEDYPEVLVEECYQYTFIFGVFDGKPFSVSLGCNPDNLNLLDWIDYTAPNFHFSYTFEGGLKITKDDIDNLIELFDNNEYVTSSPMKILKNLYEKESKFVFKVSYDENNEKHIMYKKTHTYFDSEQLFLSYNFFNYYLPILEEEGFDNLVIEDGVVKDFENHYGVCYIPEGVKKIENMAFPDLNSVDYCLIICLPDSIEEINEDALDRLYLDSVFLNYNDYRENVEGVLVKINPDIKIYHQEEWEYYYNIIVPINHHDINIDDIENKDETTEVDLNDEKTEIDSSQENTNDNEVNNEGGK